MAFTLVDTLLLATWHGQKHAEFGKLFKTGLPGLFVATTGLRGLFVATTGLQGLFVATTGLPGLLVATCNSGTIGFANFRELLDRPVTKLFWKHVPLDHVAVLPLYTLY